MGYTGFYWIVLGFTGFCWVLWGPIGFNWIFLEVSLVLVHESEFETTFVLFTASV